MPLEQLQDKFNNKVSPKKDKNAMKQYKINSLYTR